jgi:hypothetical protein
VETQFVYDDESLVVSLGGGVIHQPGRAFSQSFEIRFEKATIAYEFAVIDGQPRPIIPLTIFEANSKVTVPKLGSGDPMDAFLTEIQEVISAVQKKKASPTISASSAADAQLVCQRQAQSIQSRKIISV